MARRLFVAIGCSPELTGAIAAWQKAHGDLPARWIRPEDFHVTIVPPWFAQRVEPAIESLRAARVPIDPFTIRFDRIGFGPEGGEPRILWATGSTPENLHALRDDLTAELRQRPNQPFKLHLTIARLGPDEASKLSTATLDEPWEWEELVTGFRLMESHRGEEGSRYETLAEFPVG